MSVALAGALFGVGLILSARAMRRRPAPPRYEEPCLAPMGDLAWREVTRAVAFLAAGVAFIASAILLV